MKFYLPAQGETSITIYDISGRKIFLKQEYLLQGEHTYRLEGVDRGMFFVTITTGRYSLTGKLISNGSHEGDMKITYEDTESAEKNKSASKGLTGEVVMQYNTDDRLIFTATGGGSISSFTDVFSSGKTITFDFYPCKDGDNNIYPTVKIGTQTWMTTNLKTTKFNNGDPIPLVTDNAAWMAIRYEPAYCWYNNDESTYKQYFGALYNFWTVSHGNLCPAGWHVPSYDEFYTLETYLINNGYNYDISVVGNGVGKSLASTAMIFLTPPPSTPSIWWESTLDDGCVGNTDFPLKRNATGFSAMPSGFRGNGFGGINRKAYWWSITPFDMVMGRYRDLQTDWETFSGGYSYDWAGYSVRCLKDF